MIDLRSMAVAMPEVVGASEPDAISRILTMVDVPSQRATFGCARAPVVLTKRAGRSGIAFGLLGMGMDYSPTFDRHDVRCKVGGDHGERRLWGEDVELADICFARDFS